MEETEIVLQVISAAEKYFKENAGDENGREYSWLHCCTVFQDSVKKGACTEDQLDYMSLHLAFYLASWGMYRGSSFLLQKDYKIHKHAVEILLKPEYRHFFSEIDSISDGRKTESECFNNMISELKDHYSVVRKNVKGKVTEPVSDIEKGFSKTFR